MQHAAAVRIGDRLTHVDESCEQLAKLDGARVKVRVRQVVGLDRLLQAVSFDEPHCVERLAVGVVAQTVDRHDPRVLQSAVDLGLQHEPRAEIT